MKKKKEDLEPVTKGSSKSGFKHLKWPIIIILILVFLLVIFMNYMYESP